MAVFNDNFSARISVRFADRFLASRWRLCPRQYFCKFIFRLLLLIFSCYGSTVSRAQVAPVGAVEYQIKAAFLYKFCLYIEWPSAAFASNASPFVFGVAAPDNFIAELNAVVKDHTVNDRPVQIRRIENGDLAGVQLLFVARSKQGLLPQLRAQAHDLPLLIVTESEHGLDDGGTINFSLRNNRVTFEVALDSANHQGFHLSAQLLKVASYVRGEATP